MSGIIFFSSTAREDVVTFYQDRLDFEIWVEQIDCTILKHGNLLLGFCARETADTEGVITLVYEDRATVDERHAQLSDIARDSPSYNSEYDIYQFFAVDPEGRTLEFQTFDHKTPPI